MPIISGGRTVIADGEINIESLTETQRNALTGVDTGTMIFNTTTSTTEVYNGTVWVTVGIGTDGSSSTRAAPSGKYLYDSFGTLPNGFYWIKPDGYSGNAFQVYVDFDGSVSGITGGGGWMRIAYSQDYFSQASPWTAQGSGAVSPTFGLEHSDAEANALLGASSEARQRFVSYGSGSVGFTYGGVNPKISYFYAVHTWQNGTSTATLGSTTNNYWPSGMDYNIEGDLNTFNNSGTDPTDANDAVWRRGILNIRDTNAAYLPIRRVMHDDVDSANESRYFPLVSQNSHTWCK